MRKTAIATVLAAVVVALAGCGSTAVTKAPAAPASSSASQAAPSTPDTPTPDASTDLTGPLGTSYEVTTQDESGNDIKYSVVAVTVLDPAHGGDQYTTPDPGKRFVGVKFEITGTQGYVHDNANSDATVDGSDGQVYDADFNSINAGTNFNSGDFSVSSGRSQTGWVTFQVPKGVSVSDVQWQPNMFSDQQPATWTN